MAEERIFTLSLGSQQATGALFVKTPGGGLRLERIERREILGDPAEEESRMAQAGQAVKELVSALKVKGAKTNYVISSFPVLVKFASLPALDGAQVDQIVEFEAQQQVPYPINEVVWGYQLMGEPDDVEIEVALAAVKSDELTELDNLIAGAGLKSNGAEMSPATLYNALRFNYSDVEGTLLLVDIGARTTDMIFMEGGKLFIRTVKIGGADISRAIAKEFGTDFSTSDQRKILDGFVALGGPYADHEDPEIAAISKVVRNSLTRLHSEVMRTINFYRSQQGGSAPAFVLLSGATAGLPFIREFFAEKLNLPVDHFNPFRNVAVSKGAAAVAAAQAHQFGDLVGSALAQVGEVPLRIELIPESVRKSRELHARKPALIVALIALVSLLGAVGFHFSKGAELANARAEEINDKEAELARYGKQIQEFDKQIASIDARQGPYVEAIRHRVYWIQLFNYLSNKMDSDVLYMTMLEPLSNGIPIIDDAATGMATAASLQSESIIDAFSIRGLWRENPKGSEVVYDYFKRLKGDADSGAEGFFDLKEVDISEVVNVDAGTNNDRFAYPFNMTLPLPEANRVRFSK